MSLYHEIIIGNILDKLIRIIPYLLSIQIIINLIKGFGTGMLRIL